MAATGESEFRPVLDPRIDFRLNFMSGFLDPEAADNAWWLVDVEVDSGNLEGLFGAMRSFGSQSMGDVVHIPSLYGPVRTREIRGRQRFALYAKREFLNEAGRIDPNRANAYGIRRLMLGSIVPKEQLDFEVPPESEPEERVPLPEGSVIMAVIDDGIAFAHELFRRGPKVSRVEYAWIMGGRPDGSMSLGRELDRDTLERLLDRHTVAGLLDEEAFYHDAGLIDFGFGKFRPAALRGSHGTHVMGLAAGYPPDDDEHLRPIICVQLPSSVTRDVTGGSLAPALGLAMDYILNRAARFKIRGTEETPPVVFNFSYGNFAGPHDGTGTIEQLLDSRLFAAPGPAKRRVVIPAGNSNLSRTHACVLFPEGETTRLLSWRIQPDDKSANLMQLWMPYRSPIADLVEVTVTPPDGPESKPVGTTSGARALIYGDPAKSIQVGQVGFHFEPYPTQRGLIAISVLPTVTDLPDLAVATAGVWKVKITNKGLGTNEVVEIWIERDETLPGYPIFGRQSYFDEPDYLRFDQKGFPSDVDPDSKDVPRPCAVVHAGSISGYACGEKPVVMAGFVESNGMMADYSSAGPGTPTRDARTPNRDGPDAAAGSEDSVVLHGKFSAGSRCGSILAMSGTSVAAPRVARFLADDIRDGGEGDRDTVRDKAAIDDPTFPAPPPAPGRGGAGRLRLDFRIGSERRPAE